MAANKQIAQSHSTIRQGFIQGQQVVSGEFLDGPLSSQAEALLSDMRAVTGVLSGLEENLPVKTLSPSPDIVPDGLTSLLAACHTEMQAMRGLAESIANRIGRL